MNLFSLFATKGRIGQYDVVLVARLNVLQVLGQGICVDDVGRFNAVQDHIHDRDDICQRFLLFGVKSALLQGFQVADGEVFLVPAALTQVVVGFTEEAR